MPDIWMDVDTALSEVPVNIMPLVDDTDFKTIEDAIAYNAAGMALRWHFVTSAGAYTVTSVTPTTAGNYDWTDQGDSGIYTIEIPASGGASINNDTEGYGWFTGKATGVLPWRGPVIGFRAAALNDAMCDGGDLLDVNITQLGGSATPVTNLNTVFNADFGNNYDTTLYAWHTDVIAIKDSSDAANNLKNSCLAMASGAVTADGSNSATSFKVDATLGAKATDYFGSTNGGLVLVFIAGTTNEFQSRRVTAFNGTTDFITVEEAFSATPTASDTFILIGRIEV